MPITTVKEFGEYIEENAATDINELPKCGSVAWFGPNGGFMFFEVFKPNPLDPSSTIYAIFQSDDTIRIYQLPGAVPAPAPANWKVRPPSRWTLSRFAPTYVAEAYPSLDSLADAIVGEFDVVSEDATSADTELALVIDHLESMSPLADRTAVIDSLVNLEHRGNDPDHDDEPETDPTGVAGVTGAPLVPVPLAPVPPSTTEPR